MKTSMMKMNPQNEDDLIYAFTFLGQNSFDKLGLSWAKLSSSWDWALPQLICINLMQVSKISKV